jgi:hypothetical protein
VLVSRLFGGSDVLQGIAAGDALPSGSCGNDAVRAIKGALLALGFAASQSELDGELDDSFAAALSQFRRSRNLPPSEKSPIDASLLQRIDFEVAFLEGYIPPDAELRLLQDESLLRLDPFRSSLLGMSLGIQGLDRKIVDAVQSFRKTQELGDRFCFRLSLDLGAPVASIVSKSLAEPLIFADFCKINGPCGPNVFFDISPSFKPYEAFLLANNGGRPGLSKVSKMTRPDIVSHRPPDFDWYEIKPMSLSGLREAVDQLVIILGINLAFRLPYRPGSRYNPTRSIRIGQLATPTGQPLTIYLEVERTTKGLVFWTMCIEGDYVEYFNRYRITVGILKILGGILLLAAESGIVAGAAAAMAKAIAAVAAVLGLSVGPFLRPYNPPSR